MNPSRPQADTEDRPYMNREIDEMFRDISASLTRIETQTTKTNGRATALEKWKDRMNGGAVVIVLLVIPLLTWSLLQIVNLPGTIHSEVQAAVQSALGK